MAIQMPGPALSPRSNHDRIRCNRGESQQRSSGWGPFDRIANPGRDSQRKSCSVGANPFVGPMDTPEEVHAEDHFRIRIIIMDLRNTSYSGQRETDLLSLCDPGNRYRQFVYDADID